MSHVQLVLFITAWLAFFYAMHRARYRKNFRALKEVATDTLAIAQKAKEVKP